jgi:hypothetical protein
VQFILGGVAGGSFGEGTPDIQAQKMDWCSIGPRGLTQMRCIAPETCSHTRSYSPPIHSSVGIPGTLDRRSAPASGLRPRSFQYLTSSKAVGASKPPAGAQALACCKSPRADSLNHKASSAAQRCSSTGLIRLVSRTAGAGVCRYKPIFVPKLGILARYEFLGAFLCFFVVGAFHIDGVRNMPLLIEEIGPIMRHVALTPAIDEIPFDVLKHIRPTVNLILAFPAIETSETLLLAKLHGLAHGHVTRSAARWRMKTRNGPNHARKHAVMLAGAAAPGTYGWRRLQIGIASAKGQTTFRASHGGHAREPVTAACKAKGPPR